MSSIEVKKRGKSGKGKVMHQNREIPHRARKKVPQGKRETGLKCVREKNQGGRKPLSLRMNYGVKANLTCFAAVSPQ
jgi:hypothetical protein